VCGHKKESVCSRVHKVTPVEGDDERLAEVAEVLPVDGG
jgi:hypothetical protein